MDKILTALNAIFCALATTSLLYIILGQTNDEIDFLRIVGWWMLGIGVFGFLVTIRGFPYLSKK